MVRFVFFFLDFSMGAMFALIAVMAAWSAPLWISGDPGAIFMGVVMVAAATVVAVATMVAAVKTLTAG